MIAGVRTRFAPSPTGTLHVGSARTALFNWLFAKHHHGTFILRIEDTDQKRSQSIFLKDIQESLEYLGIRADEGPFFQSQRAPVYQQAVERLLSSGHAIHHEGAVVFQTPPQPVSFNDMLHGTITVDTSLFERLVLIKSDGTPTYNFACVVDDADMRITHVIRGDDHIANTPKQIELYQALGLTPPQFAHIPLIVGADRARLSKRTGATAVADYRAVGYLPEAFVNYLALLGWSPGGNRELMPPDEMVQCFDLARVRKSAAQFDQQKLDWLNGQYLKRASAERLAVLFEERLRSHGLLSNHVDRAWLARIAALLKDRMKTLQDLEEEHTFFFVEMPQYQEEAVAQFLRKPGIAQFLGQLKERLAGLSTFDTQAVEAATRGLIAERQLQPKEAIHPVRVALTGRQVSPPLFETMSILGRERVLNRLDHAATTLAA
ncbi:MAG: glutamate--tRNA ligase [Candidatus Omnitrophica bacterium]|nr:glutamate--tRNA ligase [Candidatus Omnitrophota bacterium]